MSELHDIFRGSIRVFFFLFYLTHTDIFIFHNFANSNYSIMSTVQCEASSLDIDSLFDLFVDFFFIVCKLKQYWKWLESTPLYFIFCCVSYQMQIYNLKIESLGVCLIPAIENVVHKLWFFFQILIKMLPIISLRVGSAFLS